MTDLPPYRPCDLCGGVDQDPRHGFGGVIEGHWTVPGGEARSALDENLERLVKAGDVTISRAVAIGAAFADTTSTDRHLDCCAAAGCPKAGTDDACDLRVKAANGKTGAAMRKAAESLKKEN